MSLVSMAANETFLYIHIRECEHKDVDKNRNTEEGVKVGARLNDIGPSSHGS